MQGCHTVDLGDLETRDGQRGRGALVLTGAHIKLSAMKWARQQRTLQPSLAQLGVAVRAVVDHGVQLAGQSTHHHPMVTDVVEHAELSIA